jgi:ABC-type lipopolysaccharide export system ATPase subunit
MITVEHLTKQRGGRAVVSDVTFRCEPGTITGFLGPNGAGKTTTMRMLVGLSEPDRGAARILGGRYRDLPNPGRRVGILLDASLAVIVPIRGIQQAGDPDFDLILGVPVIRRADWIIDLARGVWGFAG